MKTKLTKTLAFVCALAILMGCMPLGAFAAGKDMTAKSSAQQGIYDVSLSVPGEVDHLGVDIIYIMSGIGFLDEDMLPALIDTVGAAVENGTTVNLGIVPFSYEADVIMPLTAIKTMEDVDNLPTMIEEAGAAFKNAGYETNGNLENALITAKKMLSASKLADHPERQHLVLISTGHVYEFNDGENNEYAACAPAYDTTNKKMGYGGSDWSRLRNAGSSQYRIPDAIVSVYNKNKDLYESDWDCYWSYIEKWVKADKIEEANGKPHAFHFGLISDPNSFTSLSSLANDEMKKYPNIAYNTTLAEKKLDTEHAIIYERAMYETYEYAKANIIDAGINFYPVYVGMYSNGKSDNGYNGKNYVGHSFMNMLAGGKAAQYSYTEDNGAFFAPIKEQILYSCSIGSTVENFLGYVEGENGYNFDFKVDGTITLTVGGVDYTTSVIEAKEGYVLSLAFTAPDATEPSFWLDYVKGNGTTEEKFVLTIGESVSLANPMTINYQVELVNAADTAALKTVDDKLYVSNTAVLHPVDSTGKTGVDKNLNRAYVINWAATEIEITNADELAEFAAVTRGEHPFFGKTNPEDTKFIANTFANQTIKLANHIDLRYIGGEEGWWYHQDKGIDRRIVDFKGTFDGNGMTIYNMKYDHTGLDTADSYRGLSMFRTMYGTIKNLTIDTIGGYLKADGSLEPAMLGYNARFSALANQPRGARIDNVVVKNANIHADNIHENDAHSSISGMLGIVTWDNTGANEYGNTTEYSLITNCSVEDCTFTLDGNNQYAGGGFAYKASEMTAFERCSVKNVAVNIGGSVDNYGGFIGEIGLASTATSCTVDGFELTAGQNNAAVGGFMGDTVGGTGWGDSVHINGCTVANTNIEITTVNAPIGGFIGDLIGGRSAIFGNEIANTVAETVTMKGTNMGEGNGIGKPGIGGFLGGLFGRNDLTAASEHQFANCASAAQISATGNIPAGGFVGTATMGTGNQMRVVFDTCAFNGTVNTLGAGASFIGAGDIGIKGTDKNYDEYINCSVSGSVIKAQAPDAQQITLGGAFSYEMQAGNDYSMLETTITQQTTYSEYKNPVAGEQSTPVMVRMSFRRNSLPKATNDLVKVEFYLNKEATEPLHVFERYLNTALDGTNYPALAESPEYALTAKQLNEVFGYMVNGDTLAKVTWLCEDGTEFTANSLVTGNMKVYASFASAQTDVTLDGESYMDGALTGGYEFVLMQGEEILQTVSSTDGKFTFAALTFNKIGTYTYTVCQKAGDNETTVYDKTIYTVTVTVSLKNGQIVTDVEMKQNEKTEDKIVFENVTIGSVNVHVNGESYMDNELSDEFEFVLKQNEETEENMYSLFGQFVARMNFHKTGIYTYTVREVKGEEAGVAYDESVYTVIVTVTREGDKLVATTELTLNGEAADNIKFNNLTKTVEDEGDNNESSGNTGTGDNNESSGNIPDTGDSILPVMLVMMATAAMMGACVIMKRKEN